MMKRLEPLIEWLLLGCAAVSVLTTVGIVAVLIGETVSFLREVSVLEFLFGTDWTPPCHAAFWCASARGPAPPSCRELPAGGAPAGL